MNIIVNIEAGEKECGMCALYQGAWCGAFGKRLSLGSQIDYDLDYVRCPACLEAEAKLKALVEAAELARKLLLAEPFPDLNDKEAVEHIDQALAAVKGKDDER